MIKKPNNIEINSKITNKELILSIIISIFSVIFLWWFWSKWIYALWFNASIFYILFLWLYSLQIKDKKNFLKDNYYWLVPIFIIVLSFSIYENPYIKNINLFILPLIIIFFLNYSCSKIIWNKLWNLDIIKKIFTKKITLKETKKEIIVISKSWSNKSNTFKKIFIWIIIFIFINLIIATLLSNADENFSRIISELLRFINITSIYKIIIWSLIFILLITLKISWKEELIINNDEKNKKLDSIISWIVIWWTLFTYCIFIFSQLETILIDNVNNDFQSIVNLVKSWFWELFFVSIINIVFFFVYYKKTIPSIQKILIAFILASIIILFSAINKMYFYVINYWLSYEKFTATYTILYFWILFVIMISYLFIKWKTDILKASLILALWMYAWLNIIPMEKIIFKTNLSLSTGNQSHILTHKYQSHMLSIDIIKDIERLKWNKIFKEQSWDLWLERKYSQILKKKWYEKNINSLYEK